MSSVNGIKWLPFAQKHKCFKDEEAAESTLVITNYRSAKRGFVNQASLKTKVFSFAKAASGFNVAFKKP